MTDRFDRELLGLYQKRNAAVTRCEALHLPDSCSNAASCWSSAHHRRPPSGHAAGEISPPWIGPNYREGGLVVVLVNLNAWGGLDFGPNAKKGNRFLGQAAASALSRGQRRLFGGDGYAGTLVWHQAAQYSATWLEVKTGMPSRNGDRYSPRALSETMNAIAMTQHIKCSPISDAKNERSQPTEAMWAHCGRTFLAREIEILRPSAIIALGSGQNTSALRDIFPASPRIKVSQQVQLGRRPFDMTIESRIVPGTAPKANACVELISVPHPAAPGGTARRLVAELRLLLQEAEKRDTQNKT
ncbi:MAG: hypothetical protein H6729_07940 [Deltaproteobacteria bacterium]|nr:hypothetical protein [Deltaproteobacteria bacterium]